MPGLFYAREGARKFSSGCFDAVEKSTTSPTRLALPLRLSWKVKQLGGMRVASD
jgi:hypothetical protein